MTTASLRRRVAFAFATSDDVESMVRRIRVLDSAAYRTARRYVAGDTQEEALAVARRLLAEGFGVALDFFGENVGAEGEARAAGDLYVALAHAIAELDGDANLALDPSHIGLDVSPSLFREQLERIAAALPPASRIDVGAEDSARTDATLRVVREVAQVGAPLQMTLQANLRRSADDWPALVEVGIALRLVKGAYVEDAEQAYAYGDETDIAYVRLAHELHRAHARVALATHDPVIREALLTALGPMPVEMLLGVREDDARKLIAHRIPVRLYVPFGRRWFRYWMRRVAEAQGA